MLWMANIDRLYYSFCPSVRLSVSYAGFQDENEKNVKAKISTNVFYGEYFIPVWKIVYQKVKGYGLGCAVQWASTYIA